MARKLQPRKKAEDLHPSLVNVSKAARRYFGSAEIHIASTVFERHVRWDSSAMRTHGVYLEEDHRLDQLLRDAAAAPRTSDAEAFYHRSLPSDTSTTSPPWVCLQLKRVRRESKPTGWVISIQ